MAISNLANKMYGYLAIPIWILFFFGTTAALVALAINARIRTAFSGKKASAQFSQRSIFPYEHI